MPNWFCGMFINGRVRIYRVGQTERVNLVGGRHQFLGRLWLCSRGRDGAVLRGMEQTREAPRIGSVVVASRNGFSKSWVRSLAWHYRREKAIYGNSVDLTIRSIERMTAVRNSKRTGKFRISRPCPVVCTKVLSLFSIFSVLGPSFQNMTHLSSDTGKLGSSACHLAQLTLRSHTMAQRENIPCPSYS
jgi:hypothetical protein